MQQPDLSIFSYPKYRSEKPAPFLPMSRAEMQQLGWDSCDVIIISGDAYVDHPSFGSAIITRLLESQGYRVAVLAHKRVVINDTLPQVEQFDDPWVQAYFHGPRGRAAACASARPPSFAQEHP